MFRPGLFMLSNMDLIFRSTRPTTGKPSLVFRRASSALRGEKGGGDSRIAGQMFRHDIWNLVWSCSRLELRLLGQDHHVERKNTRLVTSLVVDGLGHAADEVEG